jgi:hypothetical protein
MYSGKSYSSVGWGLISDSAFGSVCANGGVLIDRDHGCQHSSCVSVGAPQLQTKRTIAGFDDGLRGQNRTGIDGP